MVAGGGGSRIGLLGALLQSDFRESWQAVAGEGEEGNGLCWFNSDRTYLRCCIGEDPDCWQGIWITRELCCFSLTEQSQRCFDSIEEKVEAKIKTLRDFQAQAEYAELDDQVQALRVHMLPYQAMLAQPMGMWSFACSVPDSPLLWSPFCDCCDPAESQCEEEARPNEDDLRLQHARCCFPVYARKTLSLTAEVERIIDGDLQSLRPQPEIVRTHGPQLFWNMGGTQLARGCVISVHQNATVSSCAENHACRDFDCSYLRAVLMALQVIQAINPLPVLAFVLNAGDETVENTLPEAPVFTRTGTRWTNTLALPFEWQLHPGQCVRKLKEGMLALERSRWEDREPVLIWRGTHSNLWAPDCKAAHAAIDDAMMERCVVLAPGKLREGVWNFSTWLQLPRGRLVWLSRFVPFIDAKFVESTTLPPMALDLERFLKDEGLFAPRLSALEFEQYKYQIALEGNSATDRLAWQLFMGSVVLIPDQPWQVMSPLRMLQPWVHFVPVSYDLSDLVDRLQWLISHDAEAKAIAQNGVAFAHRHLTCDDYIHYIDRLLRAYAKKLHSGAA